MTGVQTCAPPIYGGIDRHVTAHENIEAGARSQRRVINARHIKRVSRRACAAAIRSEAGVAVGGDRKSVVQGKSVSVRVDLGGRRSINKKDIHKSMTITLSFTKYNSHLLKK